MQALRAEQRKIEISDGLLRAAILQHHAQSATRVCVEYFLKMNFLGKKLIVQGPLSKNKIKIKHARMWNSSSSTKECMYKISPKNC